MNTNTSIPVTILTGFLGAGKTTLLNRLLNGSASGRFAVIENEFGEIGIDQELVDSTQGNLFEMNNGCLCCTVRTDLIRILDELWNRREAFDYVLIESTGLADPGAVVQTFVLNRELAQRYRLDAIVSLADALHLPQQLKHAREANQQLRYADVILLNKMDLVKPAQAPELEKLIRLRNLHARIYPCAFADIPLEQVLNIRAFDMDHILASDPDFLDVSYPFEWSGHYLFTAGEYQLSFENEDGHAMQILILYANDGSESAIRSTTEGARAIFRQGFLRTDFNPKNELSPLLMYDVPESLKRVKATIHLPQNGDYLIFLEKHPHHLEIRSGDASVPALHTERYGQAHAHESVQSVAITFEGTLDGGKVEDWLTQVLETQGDDLYRTKGILSVSHSDRKIIIQAVHRQLNSRLGADWGAQSRQNVLVFIGRNLDRRQLESGLLACRTAQSGD